VTVLVDTLILYAARFSDREDAFDKKGIGNNSEGKEV
jgi:hypothetical protein